ncbi:MAG: helix-turn-helix transcriptional regulator [Candidatus Borkfalkiaceae bacterium]|nr:helix-turn-helix transcriptional regulator [Clostridia bacterium]MDY6223637.1 helix-turn-helix transcriptional regulator [Christensenellaceae bacterium]
MSKISYKPLWKILIDKDLKKKDLVEMANISNFTLNKLSHNGTVTTETLLKICSALNCSVNDIVEIIED